MSKATLHHSVYEELGVRTVIHAAGTKTTHGGSRMRPEVIAAMAKASESFVSIIELNRRIGEYIARITGAEAGMVTSGAASGVVLSMAACMTGTDVAKVRRLPSTQGMKDELIIKKIHRGDYSHMYTFTGAKFVEVGDMNDCLPEELEAAFTEKTAAVAFLLGPRVSRTGLDLPEVAKIAHRHGVPVIVDAAAMLPPKDNLRRFIREGADLVTFSGGKLIHGPQTTGLLFGRKDLVEAAMANSSPNHAIGRPHKVSRENMVGLYTALKLYMDCDEEKLLAEYRQRLLPVVEQLRGIAGLRCTIEHDPVNYHVPNAVVAFTSEWTGARGPVIAKAMLSGEPPVFMQYFKGLDHLVVNPISLSDGEAQIVARRLREEIVRHQIAS